jgi:hypothetical protein
VEWIELLGVKAIVRDLAELSDTKRDLWQKQDSIRHDPDAVAKVLIEIMQQAR